MELHTSSKSSFASGYLWTFGAMALPPKVALDTSPRIFNA